MLKRRRKRKWFVIKTLRGETKDIKHLISKSGKETQKALGQRTIIIMITIIMIITSGSSVPSNSGYTQHREGDEERMELTEDYRLLY